MKVCILNHSSQELGGGWTFIRNLKKGLDQANRGVEIVSEDDRADILFIPSSTMTTPDAVRMKKEAGSRVVLRVDGIPEDSRNRGTGYSRMLAMAELADIIVFQSEHSRQRFDIAYPDLLERKNFQIITNGVDDEVFNLEKPDRQGAKNVRFLYVQYNRHDNKRFQEAREIFRMFRGDKTLVIVGRFSPEMTAYRFDCFPHEDIEVHDVQSDSREIAKIMKTCDVLLFPAFMDAMPNTVLEAKACGLPVILHEYGGGIEGFDNAERIQRCLFTSAIWKNPDPYFITARIRQLLDSQGQDISRTIKAMAFEYISVFDKLVKSQNNA